MSPTYVYAVHHKRAAKDEDDGASGVGAWIRKYNRNYLQLAIAIAVVCVLCEEWDLSFGSRNVDIAAAILLLWFIPISRANEIIHAFLRDAIDKVNNKEPVSDLSYGERLRLALRSYVELVVNFATLYYVMPADWFDKPLETYPQALYYSGVTITTLGYGDFAPKSELPQLLSVYQVFCGFSLLIVSFTVYVSRGTSGEGRGGRG